ncbi:MAG: DUF3343 domain-containing protein [Clostridia bacterium]|nr:DUF3343 domain-containing protein [Clostridia bacterium]
MNNKGYDSRRGTPLTSAYSDGREGECVAVLGTMTAALQAQKVLAQAAVFTSVTKISSSKSAKGCAYGISYPCAQKENVRTILSRAQITVKKYLGG